MKQDDYLRQALSQLAQEEADQLESSLTRDERRRAESMFQRHKRHIFSLIARNSRRSSHSAVFLRVAAVLVAVLGSVFLLTRQAPPDYTLATPVSTASVAPYLTDAPTETPAPTPSPSPHPTFLPSQAPSPTAPPTASPTPTPEPTQAPTPTPTAAPTLTPVPSPTPEPTQAPTAVPQTMDVQPPAAWTGSCYPALVPWGSQLDGLTQEEGQRKASYTSPAGSMVFTEYDAVTAVSVGQLSQVNYVQLGDDLVGLQTGENGSMTITWDAEGKSFSLTAPEALAPQIAQSVRKVK